MNGLPADARMGYKILDGSLRSCVRGFQYEIGKTYQTEDKPCVASGGFHIYEDAAAVLFFLAKEFVPENNFNDPFQMRIVVAAVWGDVCENKRDSSVCGSHIKILSETSREVLMPLCLSEMNDVGRQTKGSFASRAKAVMYASSRSYSMSLLEYPLSVAYIWGSYCNVISKSGLVYIHVKGNKNTVVTQCKGAHIVVTGDSNGSTIISNSIDARIKVSGRGTRVISSGDFARIDIDAPDVQLISSGACPSFRFRQSGTLVSLVADIKNNNRFRIIDKNIHLFDKAQADEWFSIDLDGKLVKGRSCGMNETIWKLKHRTISTEDRT